MTTDDQKRLSSRNGLLERSTYTWGLPPAIDDCWILATGVLRQIPSEKNVRWQFLKYKKGRKRRILDLKYFGKALLCTSRFWPHLDRFPVYRLDYQSLNLKLIGWLLSKSPNFKEGLLWNGLSSCLRILRCTLLSTLWKRIFLQVGILFIIVSLVASDILKTQNFL